MWGQDQQHGRRCYNDKSHIVHYSTKVNSCLVWQFLRLSIHGNTFLFFQKSKINYPSHLRSIVFGRPCWYQWNTLVPKKGNSYVQRFDRYFFYNKMIRGSSLTLLLRLSTCFLICQKRSYATIWKTIWKPFTNSSYLVIAFEVGPPQTLLITARYW